ncbi:hypothetical protein, partial [Collinsella sp. LCP21S3_C7]|uniref:hypothetical protein n=1 Tax=Collinsella sp. LCP21S3_C7 TaxID=3438772 RepID=UPI003F923B6C
KSPIAAFLASMSCFTLKSTRIKSLPFLMSKKWEAVHDCLLAHRPDKTLTRGLPARPPNR